MGGSRQWPSPSHAPGLQGSGHLLPASPSCHHLFPRPPWMCSVLCSGISLLPVSLATRSAPGRQGFLSVLLMAMATPPCPWTAPGPQLALRKRVLSEHAASTGPALFSHASSQRRRSQLGPGERRSLGARPRGLGAGVNLFHGPEGPPQSYRMAGGWRLEAGGPEAARVSDFPALLSPTAQQAHSLGSEDLRPQEDSGHKGTLHRK